VCFGLEDAKKISSYVTLFFEEKPFFLGIG